MVEPEQPHSGSLLHRGPLGPMAPPRSVPTGSPRIPVLGSSLYVASSPLRLGSIVVRLALRPQTGKTKRLPPSVPPPSLSPASLFHEDSRQLAPCHSSHGHLLAVGKRTVIDPRRRRRSNARENPRPNRPCSRDRRRASLVQSRYATDCDDWHEAIYVRLLDADTEGSSKEHTAKEILGIDPAKEPDRARKALHSHHSRAY